MGDPAPIYVSTPGVLINTTDTPYSRYVYISPVSTIGEQGIVRDIGGAAATYPIVVSTTNGAIFVRGLSTFFINQPYGFFSYSSAKPNLILPLYASTFQPIIRYGTESNFTPSFQYISTAIAPSILNVASTTHVHAGATAVFDVPLIDVLANGRFAFGSLSTNHMSTSYSSTFNLTLGEAYVGQSTITSYLSASSAYVSTVNAIGAGLFNDGPAVVDGDANVGSLTIGSNWSLRGVANFADVSGGGSFSTLRETYVGGCFDISGANGYASFISSYGNAEIRSTTYVSSAVVAETLSTLNANLGSFYISSMAIGKTGLPLEFLDVSGSVNMDGRTLVPAVSTNFLSIGTLALSSLSFHPYSGNPSMNRLDISGTDLYLNGTLISSAVQYARFFNVVSSQAIVRDFLHASSTFTSTLTIGSTITFQGNYMSTFPHQINVFGEAHTSSIKAGTDLWVAVGSTYDAPGFYTSSIKYSSNGLSWNNARTGGFLTGWDVVWNGRTWVAVGTTSNRADVRSTIQWSRDGSNWNNCLQGGFNSIGGGLGVAWNGRIWIATGEAPASEFNSTIQWSPDGSNFFATTTTNFANSPYGNVSFKPAWNGLRWVAGRASTSNGNNLALSLDGLNWSNASNAALDGPTYSIGWNGRYFLASGTYKAGAPQTKTLSISEDSINWVNVATTTFGSNGNTPILDASGTGVFCSLWNGLYWLAAGNDAASGIQTSYDGFNWSTTQPTGLFNSVINTTDPSGATYYLLSSGSNAFTGARSITWDGSRYVAVGCANYQDPSPYTIAYSDTGSTWIGLQTQTTNGFAGLDGWNTGRGGGNAVAYQSNCQADIQLPNLEIITSRIQNSLMNNAQIYSLSTTITLNQTLFIDSQNQTSINSYYSSFSTAYLFYIDGSGSMLTLGAAKPTGTTWTSVSDQRVKENIKDADTATAYDRIQKLQVRYFKYNDEIAPILGVKSGPQYGFYAQELETVFPESVINTTLYNEHINRPTIIYKKDADGTILYNETTDLETGEITQTPIIENIIEKNIPYVKMVNPEQVHMAHYAASAYIYSTLKHQTSTIEGITAALKNHQPVIVDISAGIHSLPNKSLIDIYNSLYSNIF